MKRTLKTVFFVLLVISTLVFITACTPEEPSTPDPCAQGHSYGEPEIIKAATCGEVGKQKVKCSVCSHELESDIPATGNHEMKDEWEVVLEPTQGAEGKKVKKCKVCGIEMQTETILSAVDVDLSAYSVIYDAGVTANLFSNVAKDLASDIGHSATVNSDIQIKNKDAVKKEILIGETDRPESAAALALLDKDGFAITYTDGKIAIIGTNTAQTICGVNYFAENYLDDSGKALSLPAAHTHAVSEVELLSEAGFGYTFIYDEKLDDKESNPYGYDKGRDYICEAVDSLRQLMGRNAGMTTNSKNFPKTTDEASTASKEFIIGSVDRAEYLEIAKTIDANEYAIAVKGDKIILAAWNVKAMEACVTDFEELMKDVKETTSSTKVWNLPSNFYAKGVADEKWITDFPRPDEAENISLTRSIDANHDSLQFLYTGSGVSADAFEAYCQKLVAAGYAMNSTNTIENSIFRLYVNEAKGIVLNVAYTDYKYADDFYSEEKKAQDGKFYIEYEKAIRVTSSPIGSITLPDSSITTPNPTYTKVADSTMTAMGLAHDYVGMCYIIRLEDGSFIVYDGGFDNGSSTTEDLLWDTLVKLHTEAYGSAPSESNPLRISAWVITHSHYDHFAAASNMLEKYGQRADFRMDYLIGSFPAASVMYPSSGMEQDTVLMGRDGYIANIQSYVTNGGAGSFKYVEAFAGQKFYFANLALEVLMTYEDHPTNFYDTNDTSTVTRIYIGGTDAAAGATTSAADTDYTTTALFLGDSLTYQSRYLCAMYGSYLESDMVQMAHHGNNGCEIELYDTVRPSVILWPECRYHIENYCNPDNYDSAYKFHVDQFVRYELDSVEYIFGSDENYATTIDLGVNGFDYDNFYDLWTGEKLTFDGIGATKK